jgi:hypothetical protein
MAFYVMTFLYGVFDILSSNHYLFIFQVMYRKFDSTIYCSCRRFEQFGLLCRHVFYILKMLDIREFPKQYILRRWTREAVPNAPNLHSINSSVGLDLDDGVQAVMREILFSTEYTLSKLSNNLAELNLYKEHVKVYMSRADEVQIVAPPPSKRDRIAELTGHTQNNSHPVRVPIGYKSKGSGSHKRLKSKQEEAIIKAGKKARQCQNCKKYGHYASTCKEDVIRRKPGEGSSRSRRFDTLDS